jgi:FAD:protein FMN transferase
MRHDVTFTAMGSLARVVVHGDNAARLSDWAETRLADLEGRWSRFRPDSEISALNRAAGRLTMVSAETFTLVAHAVQAWEATRGLFDPTMLGELVAHGYDRTHDDLAPPSGPLVASGEGSRGGPAPLAGLRHSACDEIVLEEGMNAIQLPPGMAIDPGGIGKGLAADLVSAELMAQGAKGAMVNLGGDLRVIGDHPDDGPVWTVVIDDPNQRNRDLFSLGFADGGVATSSQLQRRWAGPGGDQHHLLDPTTGAPSASAVGSAVVAAGSAWWAEVLAKAALLAGFDAGAALIRSHGAAGVLFAIDGAAHDVGLMEQAAVKP